ncbi:MAG: sugar phosphate isomerase/epimerase family protein [Oliverpabstia sp.]
MDKLPVGIQVYGLRDMLENSPEQFETVMRKIKAMGYDGVELAGLYGLSPEYVRDTLKALELTPVSAHVPLTEMMENTEKTAEAYRTIGCRYIVVPYLPEQYRPLTDGYEKVLAEMTRIGKVMAEYGLTLLYHNHDFEFVRMPDGSYGFDDIYKQVPAEYLKAEPDTCWIKVAGEKPEEYVRKYRKRCPIVHLKDFIKDGNPTNMYKLIGLEEEEAEEETGRFEFRPVGFGQQIWDPVLEATLEAGAEWVVVEQDEHNQLTSLECARRSREYLKILGW